MIYDVFGIGSALMDFLIEVHNDELIELDLKKGQFHLIEEDESKILLKRIENYKVKTSPGGSSANTLYGIAILGGNVVFCGKVGKDKNGPIYEEKMLRGGVRPRLARSDKITGHAITFITPDSERTFAVHLGAAMELKKEDVFFEDLKQSKLLHIEGYQLEDKELRSVSLCAMEFAKKHNIKISIDLGDPGIVARNKKDIKDMIEKFADIVFANE
ncbi:MAG: adenosine kinase, partial [Nanoarchaeota archaeon]